MLRRNNIQGEASMRELFTKYHIGALQFCFLALLFGATWLFESRAQVLEVEYLVNLLLIEFPVLLYGWLIIGFFFIPLALVDSRWFRRILLFFASLFALGASSNFSSTYGYSGSVVFLWLLFMNYGTIFVTQVKFDRRSQLAIEITLRTLFFLFVFVALIEILNLPNSIGARWYGRENTLLFGFLYFSIAASFEFKRYFQRGANFIYHFLKHDYVRLPYRKVRYRQGRLKAHVVKYSNAHSWWIISFSGIFLLVICAIFFYASFTADSPWGMRIVLWVFLTPFTLFGLLFVLNGPRLAYKFFRAKPAYLTIQEYELTHEHKLYAEGFIPKYIENEKRETFLLTLIAYKILLPKDEYDTARLKKVVEVNLSKDFVYSTDSQGTKFSVDCDLPLIPPLSRRAKGYFVWHLQAVIHDAAIQAKAEPWKIAFTLPVEGVKNNSA